MKFCCRCLKNSSKIDVESTPLINNNIKENRITHQIPSIQNIKDTEKVKISNIPNTKSTILIEKSVVKDTKITKISNVPDTKSTILIEKTIPKDQSQSVNDSTVTLNSSKESDISSNKENTSSEESPMPITNVDSDKAIDTQLILLSPLQNDKTEKSVVSFTEYETPLMGMKSNHRQVSAFQFVYVSMIESQ